MSSWQDFKEPIDYINQTYCKTQNGDRKIFAYGCSLGAICLTLYLINDAKNSPVCAAGFYGAPLSPHLN